MRKKKEAKDRKEKREGGRKLDDVIYFIVTKGDRVSRAKTHTF